MIDIAAGILSLGSLLVAPIFDFVKKKFLPQSDSPDATLNTLAITNPDILAPYIEAQSKLVIANTAYYNRDVIGNISVWVSNLRAVIRPSFVLIGLLYFFMSSYMNWHVDESMKYVFIVTINSWFGCRIVK